LPAIGADVELRQLALEQARDMAADRMRVIEHHAMAGAQAGDFGFERGVIGIEPARTAAGDLGLVRHRTCIERLTIKGRGRAQFGRRLPRIERGARRIAVAIDDRARNARGDQCRARSAAKA
jgi:hypothetical protein